MTGTSGLHSLHNASPWRDRDEEVRPQAAYLAVDYGRAAGGAPASVAAASSVLMGVTPATFEAKQANGNN